MKCNVRFEYPALLSFTQPFKNFPRIWLQERKGGGRTGKAEERGEGEGIIIFQGFPHMPQR